MSGCKQRLSFKGWGLKRRDVVEGTEVSNSVPGNETFYGDNNVLMIGPPGSGVTPVNKRNPLEKIFYREKWRGGSKKATGKVSE